MNKKELKQEYKLSHRPMGVFQIRNQVNEKIFVGSSLNIPGIFNRLRLDLSLGKSVHKELQREWNEHGEANFIFEILDELTPRPDPAYDYREDLTSLEELWLEKLEPYGDRGYNQKKRSVEEKLRRIAENARRQDSDD